MRPHGRVPGLQYGIGRIGRDAVVHGDVDALRRERARSGSTSPSFTSTASVTIMTRRYPN